MALVLHVQGLRYRAGDDPQAPTLQLDSLRVESAQLLGIEGAEGAGKSTLLDLLALVRKPTQLYRLELMRHDITPLWRDGLVTQCAALRAAHVGLVMPAHGLLASITVRDNLRLSQRLLDRRHDGGLTRLMDILGLTDVADRLPRALSPLQLQLAAVGRALAHSPALVLADMPEALLPADDAGRLLDGLLAAVRETGAALVVTTRDGATLRARGVPVATLVAQGDRVRLEATA